MISRSGTRISGASSGVTKILREACSGPVVTAGSVVSGLERMFMAYPPLNSLVVQFVIARSVSDEAIQSCGVILDCFAALAMTVDGLFIRLSRGLCVLAEPLSDPRVGVGVLGDVADDGNRVGAGGKDRRGLFELDATDRDQRNVADPLLPLGDLGNPLRSKTHRLQRGRVDRS